MSDNRFDAIVSVFDQLRGRRHALRLAAIGLYTTHIGSGLEPASAKKKKKKHKHKKKRKQLPFPERCFASCDATCGGCWLQPNSDSLICGEGSLSLEFPCTSNADCADPDYPSCVTGYYDRETGEFFPIGDGQGNCSNVDACMA